MNFKRFPFRWRALRPVFALPLVFALLIFGARGLGSLQPLPQAMSELHLTECALPCWLGIVPGETTFDEALERLNASTPLNIYVRGSLIYADYQPNAPLGQISLQAWGGVINLIHLTPGREANLALGDIVQQFGVPRCEIASPHPRVIYTSPDSLAAVVVSGDGENRWRKRLINIEIRAESPVCG